MSNKQVRTPLTGFEGPFFPRELSELHQKMYGQGDRVVSGLGLIKLFERIPSFRELSYAKTEDGHHWPEAAEFRVSGIVVRILFPFAQDFLRRDGSLSERHCALYAESDVNRFEIRRLLVAINHLWDEYYPFGN